MTPNPIWLPIEGTNFKRFKMNFKALFIFSTAVLLFTGCASKPILPKAEDIDLVKKVDKDCRELGPVSGTTITTSGKPEEAILDMQKSAAELGSTHVLVHQFSGSRTAVTGTAYDCP